MVETRQAKSAMALKAEKRHSKPWRFEYQTAEIVRTELIDAMVSSDLFSIRRKTTLAPKLGKVRTHLESESDFKERLERAVLVPREKQTEDFRRHGLATLSVPFEEQDAQVIDISVLKKADSSRESRHIHVWVHRFRANGILIAISTGKQQIPNRELLKLDQYDDLEGLSVRFYTTGAEHKIPPFDPEITPVYRASYYQEEGRRPPSLLIRNH